MFLNLRFVF